MTSLDRRHLLMGLGAALTAVPSRTVSSQQALDAPPSDKFLRRLAEAEQNGKVSGLHALLVSKDGRLLFEHYGKGDRRGQSRDRRRRHLRPEVLHDLRSVSKSVVGLALWRGARRRQGAAARGETLRRSSPNMPILPASPAARKSRSATCSA